MNPNTVAKAIRNNRETAMRVAVERDWRIRTDRKGATLILSNRPEGEK